MRNLSYAALGIAVIGLGLSANAEVARKGQPASATTAPKMAVSHATGQLSDESQTALVGQYCATCHSERGKAGGLTLAAFDATTVDQHAETVEKMIRKLRAGMMPPAGAK